jgi:hypothetical protein
MSMKQVVAFVQGIYYVLTGAFPFVSRSLFEAVTGPKSDWWLVEMVGLLAVVIGVTLIIAAARGRVTEELVLLAIAAGLSFVAIDVTYVAQGQIWRTYLIDAAIHGVLFMGWIVAWIRRREEDSEGVRTRGLGNATGQAGRRTEEQ